ncbi:2-methylcitrate dehydratase 2 [compost metagenome]
MTRTNLDTHFTAQIASQACQRQWETMPADACERVAQCLLDWFGVALRGSTEPVAAILRQEALLDGGSGVASIVGHPDKMTVLQAALVNGAASHALDFDDVHIHVGHPSVAILPALLALGEARRADGRSLAVAYLAGYEAACLVGAAIGEAHYDRGFHTTATIGIIGAAVACARLMELPEDGMRRAIGLAATQAAGLKVMFGTMAKPFHAGRAARDGLHAARLSAAGLSANAGTLDGERGFLSLLGDGTGKLPAVADGAFELRNNLFKYHAACYLTHAAIDAARRIAASPGFRACDIDSVIIAARASIDSVCNIAVPTTGLEMKFSIRYAVAMALGGFDTGSPEAYSDDQVAVIAALPFLPRVRVALNEKLPLTYSHVDVHLKSGQVISDSSDSNRPAIDLAGQRERLVAKFHKLAANHLDESRRRRFVAAVLSLEQCEDVGKLFRLIQS